MNLNDILIFEGDAEATEEQYFASLQRAINSGMAWHLQGSYGRAAMDAIEAGRCMLGKVPRFDYWSSRIPSRDQVADHTKGSYSFVAERCGEEWAQMIAAAI